MCPTKLTPVMSPAESSVNSSVTLYIVNVGDLAEKLKLGCVDVGAVSHNELAACVRQVKPNESCRAACADRMWLDPLVRHIAKRLYRRGFHSHSALVLNDESEEKNMEVGKRCFS